MDAFDVDRCAVETWRLRGRHQLAARREWERRKAVDQRVAEAEKGLLASLALACRQDLGLLARYFDEPRPADYFRNPRVCDLAAPDFGFAPVYVRFRRLAPWDGAPERWAAESAPGRRGGPVFRVPRWLWDTGVVRRAADGHDFLTCSWEEAVAAAEEQDELRASLLARRPA